MKSWRDDAVVDLVCPCGIIYPCLVSQQVSPFPCMLCASLTGTVSVPGNSNMLAPGRPYNLLCCLLVVLVGPLATECDNC